MAFSISVSQADAVDLVRKVESRDLMPRDLAVHWALLSFVNPIDFKVKVRAKVIAERLGMQDKHVISSISRLCKAKHVARLHNLQGNPVLLLLSPTGSGVFPRDLADYL